jgi:SAM-dependent methyltransferase
MSGSLKYVRRVHAAARAASVAEHVRQFDNLFTHAQYGLAYDVAKRTVQSGDKVLDWGCGNGHFSYFLESLGARVTGYSYEPPPRAMANSPTFEFVPGLVDNPTALPFPDRAFDITISMGVLEHVWELGGDERISLAELARVTRPGGRLLTFHLPNRNGWVEPTLQALSPGAPQHGRRFNASEIRELWDAAGFDVTEVVRYNALPRNQIRLLPAAIRRSYFLAAVYHAVDGAFERLVPRICTNFCVVARRREA